MIEKEERSTSHMDYDRNERIGEEVIDMKVGGVKDDERSSVVEIAQVLSSVLSSA